MQYSIDHKTLRHLSKNDSILKTIIDHIGVINIQPQENNLLKSLSRIIVSQQLSAAAARTIWGKTSNNIKNWNANYIRKQKLKIFTKSGISSSKARYITDLAEIIYTEKISINDLNEMSEIDARKYLTNIRGIGDWSVDMFLIFVLCKENIFPENDVGLKRAIMLCYGLDSMTYNKNILNITDKWIPYRSISSRYMWKWLDNLNKPNK